MSKLLTNQIANYNDNGPVEAKEGLNFPTGKPLQVAGAPGASGQYLKSTGTGLAWETFPSIPAAQVNADWNASSGVSQILNKPTLATVATSGSYTDLTNQPTIPAAQVNADWNASSGLAQILNKPTLFSGSYADLTGKPVIPATITDLADVNLPTPIPDGIYMKWDATQNRWVTGTGSSGLIEVVEDTSPQLGGNLSCGSFDITGDYNSTISLQGPNSKLRFYYNNLVDLPPAGDWPGMFALVQATGSAYYAYNGAWRQLALDADIPTDTNTTYSQAAVANASGVTLRLTDSGGVQDDIAITAGTGIVIDNIGSNGFRIYSTATGTGGGATVTTSDTPPTTPVDGDLWWKSNEGRLKVFYADGDSTQWVDASPPLALPNVPVAAGFITINAATATWSGTTGYTVTGAQPGGAGTDFVYTLTFPNAYASRIDYIVHATYDGTNYVSSNGCELAVARGTSSVVFTPRRFDGQPISLGEIMVSIINL